MELILYKPSTPSPINFQDIVIRDFNYSDQDAGDGQITADYYLSDLVETEDWIGCYVSYKSETFTIREAPVRVKDNTTLMYKYTLRFSPYKALLKDWYFLDYVTEGSDVIYTGLAQTNFYGNIDEFVGRLISNLNKKEPSEWTVLNSASTEDKTRYYNFNFDSVYIWDALLDMQENLDIPFRVFGKTIEIGDVGTVIQHDGTDVNFRYGSTDKGLYSISRTPAPENRYNRIIPVGGDRNLPLNFYREELPSIALRTPYLMPKIFRSGDPLAVPPVAPGTKWWYDHPDKLTSEPVRELFMKFSDVYPTIEGATYNSLPIDELYTVPPSYIDTIKEDGKPDEQTFNIGTTNMGFNIPSYISSTEEMKIEMKTGACAGCTFKVANVNGKSFNRYDYIHNLIARPTLVSEQGVAYPAGTIIKNPILAYDAYVAGDLKIAEVLYDPESSITNNDTFATITYTVTIYFENESVSRKELFSTFMVTVPPLTKVYLNEQYSSLLMVPANDSFYAESGLWNLYAEVEVTSTGKEDFGKSYIMGNFNFAENFIENVVVIKDPPTVVPPPGGNTILLQKDIETFGTLMPNTAQPLAVGDKFVITGIELPKTPYVDSAELRLETLGLAELEKAFTHKYSYSLGLDEKFLTLNNDIIPQLKIGNKILVDGNTEPLRITQCSVTYKEGRLLPEYTLAINNTTKPIQSAFKEINSKLAQIASNTRIVNEGSAVQVRTVESQIKKVEALAHDVYTSASSGQALSELGYIPENAANKTDIISQLSTVIQYPSAKAVYDRIQKLPHYSFGAVQFPSYIENPDGTFTVGAGKYCLSDNPDGTGFITCYDIPGATFTLTNQTQNYIVANYNNGSPTLQVITNVGLIDERMIVPVFSVYRNGTVLHTQWWDMIGAAAVNKLHQSVVKTQRYRRESGLALSEYGTNNLALSSGIIWVGLVPMNLSAINTATDNLSLWYHSGTDWVNTIQSTYNNSQYDNGSGLVALTNNRYAVNWVFRGVESQKHLYIVLGRGDYSLSEAQGSSMPAIPTAISSHAVLVGRVIVQKGAATATSIQSAFDAQFSFAAPAAHNDLTGIQGGVAGDHQHFTTIEKTIATQSANASRAGYLLSTDWSTFNNKENAIAQGSTGQYWAWDKTWKTLNTAAVAESTNLYFTNARAVSAPLTGYVLGSNSALADTDTILTAFGKVQGQINARALSSDLSSHIGNTTIHLTADEKAYLGKIMTYLKVAVDNTSMYSTINFYSESGVSAYGIGTGGGGGAGVDIIDNLLSVRADAALSANQGRILKGFVDLKQPKLAGTGASSLVRVNTLGTIIYDDASYALTSALHNAVSIGTANGLSLSTQVLSLSLASTSVAGAMSAADKSKLDGIAANANNYSLPIATASVLGGVKIGTNVDIASGVISVHNPVTLGTANGLSLSTQALSLALATTSTNGAMSSTQFNKLAGIADNANNYVHPTTSGNKHIPSGGVAGNILKWSADGTAVWGAEYSYSLPLAASGTRGGIQIGYTASGANLPLLLSSEQAYISLTKGAIESVLTGAITSHTHSYEAPITAGTTLQYWRGDKSWQTLNTLAVPELTNLYFTEARVRASVLTGFVANNAAILATDSVLVGFNKAQGQINARALSTDLTAHINNTSPHLSADERTYFNKLKLYLKIADDNSSLYSTLNFYSESGVSAFGIGSGGGGSVGVDIIDDLLSVRTDAALSANQGRILKGFVDLKQPQLNGTGLVRMSGTSVSYDNTSYATSASLLSHTGNTSNPHSVTAAQVKAFYRSNLEGQIDANSIIDGLYSEWRWLNVPDSYIGTLNSVVYSPDWVSQEYTKIVAIPRKFIRSRYDGTTWGNWYEFWHSGNSNLTTIDWSAKNLTLAGSITGATTITASSHISTSGRLLSGNTTDGVAIYLNGTFGDILGINTSLTEYNDLRLRASNTDQMFLRTNGNVDIGYSAAQGYKFAVNGSGFFNGALTIAGALSGATTGSFSGNVSAASFTSGGNAVLHAGNYSDYAVPRYISLNGQSLNDIKTTGFYRGYGVTGGASTDISTYIVITYSNDWGTQIQHDVSLRELYFRSWTGSGGTMDSTWYKFIHSGNIGSQSVNYAANSSKLYSIDSSYAYGSGAPYYGYLTYNQGVNRWRFKVSPATPDQVEVAYADSAAFAGRVNVYAGNEMWLANGFAGGGLWLNYRGATSVITNVYVGNGIGDAGLTYLNAQGFIKAGSSSSYLLLGDGGHKAVSDFAVAASVVSSETNLLADTYTKGLSAKLTPYDGMTNAPPTWYVNNRSNILSIGHPSYPSSIIIESQRMAFSYSGVWTEVWTKSNLTNTLSNGYLPYWNGSSLSDTYLSVNSSGVLFNSISASANRYFILNKTSGYDGGILWRLSGSEKFQQVITNSGDMDFYSYTYGGVSVKFLANGNVGIGYTDRSEKLAVAGSGYFNGLLVSLTGLYTASGGKITPVSEDIGAAYIDYRPDYTDNQFHFNGYYGFRFRTRAGDTFSINGGTGHTTIHKVLIAQNDVEVGGSLNLWTTAKFVNKAANGWIEFATRDVSGVEARLNLLNLGSVSAQSIKIGANWEAIPNGTYLELRYGGVMKAKLSSSGDILAVGGVTAFAV